MCSAFHPLRTNSNIPESNIGSTVDGRHAGERKECTVCCGRTLADFVPGCVQCDKTLNFGLCSRCAPGFYLNEVDWNSMETKGKKVGHVKNSREETASLSNGATGVALETNHISSIRDTSTQHFSTLKIFIL